MGNLTKNFGTDTDPNLCCPCCNQCKMDTDHMNRLQIIRDEVGVPMGVPEGGGYRCDAYDQSNSEHKDGKGTDLTVAREYYYDVIKAAYKAGMTGIGVKNKRVDGKPSFQIHLGSGDNIPGKRPRPWFWTY